MFDQRIFVALFVVAASTVVSAKDRLPSCEIIPKLLLYCIEYILNKCVIDCFNYLTAKCPYKMQNYDEIITTIIGSYQKIESKFYNQQTTFISAAIPTTLSQPIPRNVRRQLFKKLMLFVEPNPSSPKKLFELPKAPTYQTGGDYICQNEQYPITNLSDSNLSSNYYIENSRPSYSLRLPQKLFNELFLTCCQQHIPTNCHSLCTYEHCEHIAVEALIKAIQQDDCDLKYLNNTLYCGNRNRNNRNCWQFHEISLSELEVGNRCLRMCNIVQSGDRIRSVEKTT
ncbi:DB module family protein [Acanthocheilonema viteae]